MADTTTDAARHGAEENKESEAEHFSLTSYGPVVVTVEKIKVHSSEVEDELLDMAKAHATYEPIENRDPQSGDIVAVNLATTRDGKPFDLLTQDHALIRLGAGNMPEAFEQAVLAMKVGETTEVDYSVPLPPADPAAPIESADVHSTVTLNGLRREVIPSVTDAWVNATYDDAETVEDLKKIAAKNVASRKRDEVISEMPRRLASKLAERLVGVISDEAVNASFKDRVERLEASFKSQDQTLEQTLADAGIDQAEFYKMLRNDARDTLAQGYALVALANHLKLEPTTEDIDNFLDAGTYEESVRLRSEYAEKGLFGRLVEGAKGMLAINHVVHHAIVKREDGTEDEGFERRLRRIYDEQTAKRAAARAAAPKHEQEDASEE